MTEDAFYVPDGDRFVPQPHTRGPWDPRVQHAGPPGALLARDLERCDPREDFTFVRITTEIMRPVPLEPLSVRARVERPGRSVEYVSASMTTTDGSEVMRAHGWRIRIEDTTGVVTSHDDTPPAPPDEGTEPPFFRTPDEFGYGHAMQWRFVRGSFLDAGPATAWLRMRHPLIPGEQPSGWQRVMIAADSGNGISAVLDLSTHHFINTDLTVTLHRVPDGEWICLDAETRIEATGVGVTESTLWDARGRIGRGAQSLLVGTRG